MRLSYKLSLGVGLALAVALGVDSYIEVRRSVSEYESDLLNHTSQQAHTLSVSVSKLWTSYGDGGAIEVIGAADSASPDVRAHWVNLRTLLNTFEVSNDVRPEIYAVAFTVWALALGLAFQGLRKDRREERAEQERARERELTPVA